VRSAAAATRARAGRPSRNFTMSKLLSLGGVAVRVQPSQGGTGASQFFTATKTVTGWNNGLVMTKDVLHPPAASAPSSSPPSSPSPVIAPPGGGGGGCVRFTYVVRHGRTATIGVCNPQVRWSSLLNETDHGWGLFVRSGFVGHATQVPSTKYIPADSPIREGDEVAVEVDLDAGTVECVRACVRRERMQVQSQTTIGEKAQLMLTRTSIVRAFCRGAYWGGEPTRTRLRAFAMGCVVRVLAGCLAVLPHGTDGMGYFTGTSSTGVGSASPSATCPRTGTTTVPSPCALLLLLP
jgi:hypothetical protein